MERPFRVSSGGVVGSLAAVFSLALAALFLPGMPAALIWPYEWAILGAWWLVGIVLLLRLPKIAPGRRAEEELIAATHRTGDSR